VFHDYKISAIASFVNLSSDLLLQGLWIETELVVLCLAIALHILEVLGSNFGLATGYPD
jgi:hypothetical protein